MTGQSSPATVTATLCSQCVFKMAVSIQNPAKCGVRAVIRFLHAKGETAAKIHHQVFSVYGENGENMEKWCREFEAGRSDVHDEIRSGRPSVVTDEIIQETDENIRADRRLKPSMNFINNVQKCQELFFMAKRAGGRFLRCWNKRTHSQAECIAIHGDLC
jgi:hypothetical protein